MGSRILEDAAHEILPADGIDVSDPAIFSENRQGAIFERLRREDPVHFCANSPYGPYWSVTRYRDIVEVDSNHGAFSSAGATSLDETRAKGVSADATPIGGFLGMDPPDHDVQRKIVSPALAPSNLLLFRDLIARASRSVSTHNVQRMQG